MTANWKTFDDAPRDGSLFRARNTRYPSFGVQVMLRRVRYIYNDQTNTMDMTDMGQWFVVSGIEPDYHDGLDTPSDPVVPCSIASDAYNDWSHHVWAPLADDGA